MKKKTNITKKQTDNIDITSCSLKMSNITTRLLELANNTNIKAIFLLYMRSEKYS